MNFLGIQAIEKGTWARPVSYPDIQMNYYSNIITHRLIISAFSFRPREKGCDLNSFKCVHYAHDLKSWTFMLIFCDLEKLTLKINLKLSRQDIPFRLHK